MRHAAVVFGLVCACNAAPPVQVRIGDRPSLRQALSELGETRGVLSFACDDGHREVRALQVDAGSFVVPDAPSCGPAQLRLEIRTAAGVLALAGEARASLAPGEVEVLFLVDKLGEVELSAVAACSATISSGQASLATAELSTQATLLSLPPGAYTATCGRGVQTFDVRWGQRTTAVIRDTVVGPSGVTGSFVVSVRGLRASPLLLTVAGEPLTVSANQDLSVSSHEVSIAAQPTDGVICEVDAAVGALIAVYCGPDVTTYRDGVTRGWNVYVVAGSAASCPPNNAHRYGDCQHAGAMRAVALPDKSSCDGLSAQDDLRAFEWSCEMYGGAALVFSKKLAPEKGLTDVIDAPAQAYRANRVTVRDTTGVLLRTPPTKWWDDAVVALGTGIQLISSPGVYIAASDMQYTIVSDHVAVIVPDGATALCPGTACMTVTTATTAGQRVWIEGRYAGNNNTLIDVTVAKHVMFRRLKLLAGALRLPSAQSAGFRLEYVRADAAQLDLGGTAYSEATHVVMSNCPSSCITIGSSAEHLFLSDIVLLNGEAGGIVSASSYVNYADISAFNLAGAAITAGGAVNTIQRVYVDNAASGFDLSTGSAAVDSVATSAADVVITAPTGSASTYQRVMARGFFDACHVDGDVLSFGQGGCPAAASLNATDAVVGFSGGARLASAIMDWVDAPPPHVAYGEATRGACRGTDTCTGFDPRLRANASMLLGSAVAPTGGDVIYTDLGDALRRARNLETGGACQSGDTCLYTPNIGAYQGHGPLVPMPFEAGSGPVTGVTLLRHEHNGIAP